MIATAQRRPIGERSADALDWDRLRWEEIGRPRRVENWAERKLAWEAEHGEVLPVPEAWSMFNRAFQALLDADPLQERRAARRRARRAFSERDVRAARRALRDVARWTVWNRVHRIEDAVRDPGGKRALFAGLDLVRPRILCLGAADGYDAMLLSALYPGGETVLVDADAWCEEHRFGAIPREQRFVGANPRSGGERVWRRDELALDFVVSDVRDLPYGREFDVVVSSGLVEHFPDAYKPVAFELHRRFVKPDGHAILTTPRLHPRTLLLDRLFGDVLNFSYRELMEVRQLGLYAHENGLEVLRHGELRLHNGVVCRAR